MIVVGKKDTWERVKPEHNVSVDIYFKGHTRLKEFRTNMASQIAAIKSLPPHKQDQRARSERIALLKEYYAVQQECLANAVATTTDILATIPPHLKSTFCNPHFQQEYVVLKFGTTHQHQRAIALSIEARFGRWLDLAPPPDGKTAEIERSTGTCLNTVIRAETPAKNPTPYKHGFTATVFAPTPPDVKETSRHLALLDDWYNPLHIRAEHSLATHTEPVKPDTLQAFLDRHMQPQRDAIALC